MSEIVVHRIYAWRDCIRNYRVLVDGREAARVANSSTVEIPVTPGAHVVKMKYDWFGSPEVEVTVAAGESIELECGPNSLFVALYQTFFAPQEYLWLEPVDDADSE